MINIYQNFYKIRKLGSKILSIFVRKKIQIHIQIILANRNCLMKYAQLLASRLNDSIVAKQALCNDVNTLIFFNAAVECVVAAYRNGGRLYIAGNGGSAADAQHLAAEFVSKLAKDRSPLPAEALTVDSSILTAIGNDYGFEQIFSRQLKAKAGINDVFLGISTSGNSKNIIEALLVCREKGVQSIIFTGFAGGKCTGLADWCLIVPGGQTAIIQELHKSLAHALCECVEDALFAE
jgi:D-sedoheptulose 7-phosphate isomerase